MARKITRRQAVLLGLLVESGYTTMSYSLPRSLRESPASVREVVDQLIERELIAETGRSISLTELGRQAASESGVQSFNFREKPWRVGLERNKQAELQPDEDYVPEFSYLAPSDFPLTADYCLRQEARRESASTKE